MSFGSDAAVEAMLRSMWEAFDALRAQPTCRLPPSPSNEALGYALKIEAAPEGM